MGQKIHPTGFRLAVSRNWASRWFATGRDFAHMLNEDLKVRAHLRKRLKNASVGRVLIERPAKNARITIFSARPGVVIGKKGEDIELLKADLQRMLKVPVHVNIEEIRKPEIDAQLVADSITQQLEKRIMFRRAMKRAMQNAMRLGAQGIKIMSSGRLNGAEIARTEWYREGRVPLHTLRADIDYGFSEAVTTYGIIGVKVWVYKGDTLGRTDVAAAEKDPAPARCRQAGAAGRAQARLGRGRREAGRQARCAAARRQARPESDRRAERHRREQGRVGPGQAGEIRHAATSTTQVPQGPEGPQQGHRDPRHRRVLRRVRIEGHRPGPPDGAPDRGGAPRDDPPHQAWRTDLDPDLSGQADLAEAGRGPHGQRQGQRRVLRRPDPARQGAVRDGRRRRGARAPGVRAGRGQAADLDGLRRPARRRLTRNIDMKASELRTKDVGELQKELSELMRAHFSLRMQAGTQQLNNTSQLRKVRRDVARVRTVLQQKATAK
jgi:small subunit ribosomal protein S3